MPCDQRNKEFRRFFYPDIGNAAKHRKSHACMNKVASVNENVKVNKRLTEIET